MSRHLPDPNKQTNKRITLARSVRSATRDFGNVYLFLHAGALKRSNPQAMEQDPGRELTNWLYGKNIATPDQQSPLLGDLADITKWICADTN